MNKKKLIEKFEYWKKQLRMEDVDIEFIPKCKIKDMPEGYSSVLGLTVNFEVNKSSIIRIKDPKEEPNFKINEEQVLIHELLHSKFDLLHKEHSSMEYRLLHQIIEDLSCALWSSNNKIDIKDRIKYS